MIGMPGAHLVAAILAGVYGLIALVGGIMGYVKASSTASLIAGVASGILLLICAFGIPRAPVWGLVGAILVSLALVGRFGTVALRKGESVSEMLQSTAGIVAFVMISVGILVIIAAAAGLFADSGPPPTSGN